MEARIRNAGLGAALLLLAVLFLRTAQAGGCGENAVLVVDPSDADALRLANVYRSERGIPAANLLYMSPATGANYAEVAARNGAAFLSELTARGIDDHVDYVVVVATRQYRILATGLVSDDCFPVNRFTLPFPYVAARLETEILGGLTSQEPNRFFTTGSEARAFDAGTAWLGGVPSESAAARRYYVGALLGYAGARGNTVEEIVAMIRRSVDADGTRPAGTFYFMQTGDNARSGPRQDTFPGVVAAIEAAGGAAEHILATLPVDRHDCLGVLTGVANPAVDTADFTLLPGAFCDHLTSFAATFDQPDQVKVSAWIRKGASASVGTVQEPCNYPGKFPHAKTLLYVYSGLTLGEAWFRGNEYLPFQTLFVGDPLTRPFAREPTVSVPDAPDAPVLGTFSLTPASTATAPGAAIARLDLHLDGVRVATAAPGEGFALDTRDLADGHHSLTIVATDDTAVAAVGRWSGSVVVANRGRSATLGVPAAPADLAAPLPLTVSATGGPGTEVAEIRVLHNGRTVAATTSASDTLTLHGAMLGAGPAELIAEARFTDGRRARSEPRTVDLPAVAGTPDGAAPVAFGYSKVVAPAGTVIVELPATFADDPADATFEVVDEPDQAAVLPGTTAGFRLLRPDPGATGEDELTFRVTTPSGTSNVAAVRIVYGGEPLGPEPTVVLALGKGRIRDVTKAGKDKVSLRGTIAASHLYPDAAFHPEGLPVRLVAGGAEIGIPADDPGWKRTKKGYKYRSPRGVAPKVRLTVRTANGAWKLRIGKLDLAPAPANPVRVAIEAGEFRGLQEAEWNEHGKKPGRWKYP